MNSCFVIDGRHIQDHFPGIGRYAYNLIDAIARVAPGDSFDVLYNHALANTRFDMAALARHTNIKLRSVDIAAVSLREQFRFPAFNGQLFHSPYYIKPYRLPIPSVVTIFDLLPLRVPGAVPSRTQLIFRLCIWLAVRTSARVIVPSQSTRADLIKLFRVPDAKIAVVPLAADARFQPQSDAEIARVREKYGLPERYVLYVGINKPHKNLLRLVQAWHASPESPLVIAGAWDARYELPQAEGIRRLSNIANADLPGLYAGAVVFVFPSLYEGFGLPPLEAMACGTPVVCSNASSLPEVVGDAALLVDPRSVDELAAAIRRALADPALRSELRAKSLARAAQFTWEQTARSTLDVYRRVEETRAC